MDNPQRKILRLKGYDYTREGAYFVTVCSKDRECLFGNVVNNAMRLNIYGEIVLDEWKRSSMIRPEITLDEFIVMPNHLHGIIIIKENKSIDRLSVGATRRVAPTGMDHPCGPMSGSIGAIIGQFKSITTRRINKMRNLPHIPVWQRNYYDHIVRDEMDLNRIRTYIRNNPINWGSDRNNPNYVIR